MGDDKHTFVPSSGTRRSSSIRAGDLAAALPGRGGACPAPLPARPSLAGPAVAAGAVTGPGNRDPWARRALAMGELLEDVQGRSYGVVGFLGRGGMGEVYEVEEVGTGRRLAIKCMRLTSIEDPKTIERAKAEAIVLERLRHPNVVPVYAMGVREDGLIWMVMKLLTGNTTGQVVAELGRVPLPWALMIARDVCLGLEAIHAFAIHRDIKPDNLYLDHDGQVYVLDIGAGKFYSHGLSTTNGYVIGTMAYMSPEQITEPGKIDVRSDIFSTGIALYQLVSGQHPFGDASSLRDPRAAGAAILHQRPRPLREVAPWIPGYLDDLTMRALCKEREGRYLNAPRFAAVLEAALGRLEHDVGPLPPLRFLSVELQRRAEARAAAAAPARSPTSEVTKALRGELTQGKDAAEEPGADEAGLAFAATEKVASEDLAEAMAAPVLRIGAAPYATAVHATAASARQRTVRLPVLAPTAPPVEGATEPDELAPDDMVDPERAEDRPARATAPHRSAASVEICGEDRRSFERTSRFAQASALFSPRWVWGALLAGVLLGLLIATGPSWWPGQGTAGAPAAPAPAAPVPAGGAAR